VFLRLFVRLAGSPFTFLFLPCTSFLVCTPNFFPFCRQFFPPRTPSFKKPRRLKGSDAPGRTGELHFFFLVLPHGLFLPPPPRPFSFFPAGKVRRARSCLITSGPSPFASSKLSSRIFFFPPPAPAVCLKLSFSVSRLPSRQIH